MNTYPEEFSRLKEENERLRRALKTAKYRFTDEQFSCVWLDAAEDIKRALNPPQRKDK